MFPVQLDEGLEQDECLSSKMGASQSKMRVSSKMNAFRPALIHFSASAFEPVTLILRSSYAHPALTQSAASTQCSTLGCIRSFPRISSGAAPFEHINVLEFELQRDCSGEKCLIKEFGSFSHNFHPVKKRKHFNTCLPSSTMARTSRSGTRALAFFQHHQIFQNGSFSTTRSSQLSITKYRLILTLIWLL